MKGLLRRFQDCKFWQPLLKRGWRGKRQFLIAGIILALVLLYPVVSMLAVSRAGLDLERLRRSFRDEPICHEACASEREAAESAIIKELKEKPSSRDWRRLESRFLDETEEISFRISLVSVAQGIFGSDNPPGYIRAYMTEGDDSSLKAAIISSFSASALSASVNPLDYYFEILTGADDLIVKSAAIRALSSSANKEEYFDIGQLEHIKKLIFNSGTDKSLCQSAILLLGEYYPVFPEETKNILSVFYKTESRGDSISRAFAADVLNRLGGEELIVPEISAAEWEEYYNN